MRIKLGDVCNRLRRAPGDLLRITITIFEALALPRDIYGNLSKSLSL